MHLADFFVFIFARGKRHFQKNLSYTPSKSRGRARAYVCVCPETLCLTFLLRTIFPYPSSLNAPSGEKRRMRCVPPRTLAPRRNWQECEDVSSPLEVAPPRREAGSSGRNGESAEQTTLKVVCGLSRTRALCRSESPRECAPEESVFLLSFPSPIVLPGPSAARGPSPTSMCPLLPVVLYRHTVYCPPPCPLFPPHSRPPSRRRRLHRSPVRGPAVLPEVRRGTQLDSPVNPTTDYRYFRHRARYVRHVNPTSWRLVNSWIGRGNESEPCVFLQRRYLQIRKVQDRISI